ncbi:ral GTPase-activating protein subunit beta-like isoform 3-T4 [Pholidichthys leucotaenia]
MLTIVLSVSSGLTTRTPAFRDRLPSFGINVTKSPFKDRLPSYGISRPRSGSAPPVPVNIRSMSASPPLTSASPPYNRLKATNVSKNTSKLPVITSAPSLWTFSTQTPSVPPPLCFSPRPSPSPLRCNVDSLLHLFGCWLFDAALIWRDSAGQSDITAMSETWVAGRAEACGTLCRIFTCKKTGEGIMPLYLSRFYMVLLKGLQISEMECPPVLASILLNSTCLFCCDLKGINLLLPVFISALENVLLDRELLRFKSFVCPVDLRRASILILLSLLPVPLQFGSVQTEVLTDGDIASDDVTPTSFLSLKPRLIGILIGALQTETDTYNTQLLLGAMLSFVQDLAMLEGAGQGHQDCDLSRDNRTSRNTGTTGSTRLTQGSNAAAVLWAQLVRLLTQRLTAHWRNDSAVCLSVLEVLEGLAKVEVRMEESEMRRAVSSVCTYIVFQCSRPPPSHSSELHSIIVAAFFCLNVWLTQHPTLLDHQECLLEVLEIVELGISGSKSRQEQEVRWKEKKELNPASLRVKEAAEMTLSCVMQVSGACPVVNGSLNEDALIGCSTSGDGLKKFRYFVVDGSMILAMLERGPGHEQEQHPSLTMIMRGPSGCHTWTLQLHLQPREGRSKKATTSDTCSGTAGMKSGIKHHVTAEKIDVSPVKADQSIPALHEIVTENMQHQLDRMRAALKKQQQMEARPLAHCRSVIMTSCRLPPPVTHFQTARLFLSHLGLLTPETDPGITGVPAQLVTLDSSLPGFSEDLRKLDQLPSKNCDSAFIFYMKAGQRTATEMLKNVESRCSVQSQFLDFLSSIGCTAKMGKRHMGGINTSSSEFHTVLGETGGSMFDGRGLCLMFTDALTEITFIVPSTLHIAEWSEFSEEPQFNQHGHSEVNPDPASKPTSFKVEDIKSFSPASLLASSESNVLIVWVERFEDIENFPLSDLLSCLRSQTEPRTPTETSTNNNQLIFIHPLKTGLYRICFHGNATSKFGLIMPLVSGHVVSRRSLGFLVREMVINCCHRRRLESDSAPPPHIKRKHMISDIMLRYRSQLSEPAFYSSLFREVCPHDLQ